MVISIAQYFDIVNLNTDKIEDHEAEKLEPVGDLVVDVSVD